jgi:type IV secretion system protein VirB3
MSASEGLTADVLFVAATRPPMRWGAPYIAILINVVVTMEVFLAVQNPLVLLLMVPVHGVCALLCARDARFFELAQLWMQTRMLGLLGNALAWKGATYSPLPLAVGRGRRDPRVPL